MVLFLLTSSHNRIDEGTLLLAKRDDVNLKERYIVLNGFKYAIDEMTLDCLRALLSSLNHEENYLFLQRKP
jgi:hypothetical protein